MEKDDSYEQAKRDELARLAQECIAKSADNVFDATELLAHEVKKRRDLYEFLADPLVRVKVYELIAKLIRRSGKQVWNAPNYRETLLQPGKVAELARANMSLMNNADRSQSGKTKHNQKAKPRR